MFLCGLRPQEARAIHTDQLARDMAPLLVTRQMTAGNEVVEYVKGSTAESPRYRFALIPAMGLWIFQELVETVRPVDLVFAFKGRAIRREYLRERLLRTAQRAGLPSLDGFAPYSGRATYITCVRPLLDPAMLRAMVGHSSESTTDIYDRADLLARARQVQGTVTAIDAALSLGESAPDQ
jgi:integrase